MNNRYLLSRGLFALTIGILGGLLGKSLLLGMLMFIVALASLLLIAKSGWLVVEKEGGNTSIEADERFRETQGRAARYTLAISIIALAALIGYFDYSGRDAVPIYFLSPILMFAGLGYLFMAWWFRRV